MLKYYIEQLSILEFSERDREIPRLITREKSHMNARGVLVSTITLDAIANFFAAEFLARCDFLRNFISSHSRFHKNHPDPVIAAKSLFQEVSFQEKERILGLYRSSTESIRKTLSNQKMKREIEENFIAQMDDRIKKNNLYVEIAYQEIVVTKEHDDRIFILQPNFYGIGIDLSVLWERYVKQNNMLKSSRRKRSTMI